MSFFSNLYINKFGDIILADFELKSVIDVYSNKSKTSLNYMSLELFQYDGKTY